MDAVVLAAGRGSRMGRPKHLIEVDGVPMLERVLRALSDSHVVRVHLVLRRGDAAGAALADRLGVAWTTAETPEQGRAASVRAAIESVDVAVTGLLFALADQPYLLGSDFNLLLDAFTHDHLGIVRASYDDEPGSPVLFARSFFPELVALPPGEGGRAVLARHPEAVCSVPLNPARGRDIDRPEDLSLV